MGIYRHKDKSGKPYGPFVVQYPHAIDPTTEKVLYTTVRAGYSKKEAAKILAQKMVEWEDKKQRGTENRKDLKFVELVDWYQHLSATRKLKSFAKITQHCRTLKTHFGEILAKDIRPFMIEDYQQKRLSQVTVRGTFFKPASVNREVEVLERIFNMAIREEFLDKNPCIKVSRLSEQNARDRLLSHDEFVKLTEALPPHAADIVKMGYYTGMRFGEIVGLTWDKVDLINHCLTLAPEDTKTATPRVVGLTSQAIHILSTAAKLRNISINHVFTYRRQPIKSIKTAFHTALRKVGIVDFRFHDLRHTFNTNMRRAGVADVVTMKLTGHKTHSMYTRYSTVDLDDAKEAMARFEHFLERGNRITSTSTSRK
jgi:integrase